PVLKQAERAAGKAGLTAHTETREVDDKRHKDRQAVLSFFWKRGEDAGVGRIWYCSICARVTVAQVYCAPDTRSRALASEILAEIECHSQDTDWRTWGLYGLQTEIPASYALAGQQLMNVYLQLQFQLGQSTDQIFVEQWNLANVQLKGMYLDEWFDRK